MNLYFPGENGRSGEGGVGGREARNGKKFIIKIRYVSQFKQKTK